MAHEGEEGGDGESLVAIADDLEVNGMPVVPYAQEGGGGINRDHKQDANDMSLFTGLGVV